MAHGAPDASNVINLGQDYRVDDMAELAARLGSLAHYRRDGDVFFMEDFSEGLRRWHVDSRGADSEVVLQTNAWRVGGVCPRLTVDNNLNDYAMIWRGFLPTGDLTLGVSAALAIYTPVDSICMEIEYYNGVDSRVAMIRYIPADHIFQVGTDVDVWETFASDVTISGPDYPFSSVKLVADFLREKILSFSLNDVTYDLSSYAPYVGGFPYIRSYVVWFWITRLPAGTRSIYLDNIVLTRNEV